jgi:hypothetical protein
MTSYSVKAEDVEHLGLLLDFQDTESLSASSRLSSTAQQYSIESTGIWSVLCELCASVIDVQCDRLVCKNCMKAVQQLKIEQREHEEALSGYIEGVEIKRGDMQNTTWKTISQLETDEFAPLDSMVNFVLLYAGIFDHVSVSCPDFGFECMVRVPRKYFSENKSKIQALVYKRIKAINSGHVKGLYLSDDIVALAQTILEPAAPVLHAISNGAQMIFQVRLDKETNKVGALEVIAINED